MASMVNWLRLKPISAFALGKYNGQVSHVIFEVERGAVLSWLIGDDPATDEQTIVKVHLTDDEALAVIDNLDSDQPLGMLEPVRSTLKDPIVVVQVFDRDDEEVSYSLVRVMRKSSEGDFVDQLFKAADSRHARWLAKLPPLRRRRKRQSVQYETALRSITA